MQLSFLGTDRLSPQQKDTCLWFVEIKWTALFLTKMLQQTICKYAGDMKELVHFHQTNIDSRHQNRRHDHPKLHLGKPVKTWVFNVPKSNVYHPEMYIYILLFLILNFSNLDVYGHNILRNDSFLPGVPTDEGTSSCL
jgi:hypothetical protein